MEQIQTKSESYLSFQIGNERFAAHVSRTGSIIEVPTITKIPQSQNYMAGIINIRGKALPVIDIRMKLGMSPTTMTRNTCVLILEVQIEDELIQLGALVDSVHEVVEFSENQILPPPDIGSRYKSKYIYGIVKYEERFIMLLDMDLISKNEEFVARPNQVFKINKLLENEGIEQFK